MKKVNELLRKIGGVVLAVIVLTAQMPVTAFAEEPAAVELETAVAADEDLPIGDSEAGAEAAGEAGSEAAEKAVEETAADKESSDNEDSEEAEKSGDEGESSAEEEKDGDSEEKKYPAFSESKSIDGVRITVEAEEGVFPEGATLSVEKVTVAQEKQAEEAVESERDEDKQVAASYTYDIKVLDQDGNEIQPAGENGEDSSSRVKVSFKLDEVADENLETNVYHIKEANTENTEGSSTREKGADSENENESSVDCESGGTDSDDTDSNVTGSETTEFTAEKLPVETDGDTAIAETDGFSLYTVEFTYDSKQYVLPGDSEVALSEILDTVGLTGEVSAVKVSDTSLFSAEKNEGGEWIVTARRVFSSEEWMKITINDKEYKITVTDDSDTMSFDDLQTLINNAENGGTVTLEKDVNWKNSIPGKEAGDSGPLVIPEGRTVTLDLNGHTIDRGLKGWNGVKNANVITVSGNLTLTDGSADGTGKLTGGNTINDGGGVFIDENGTFTMEGGSITDCITKSQGGGVNVNGTFNMTGGTISGCTANNGAGGGVKVSKGTFNMTGGTISGCTGRGVFVDSGATFTMSSSARIDGCTNPSGGGVYVNGGMFTMEGGTITGCTATNGDDNAQGGGGVYLYGGTFNVSGAPVISGNKKGDKTNNVTLNYSKTITVTGALTDGAEIWVNADKDVVFAKNGDSYSITDTDLAKFHSDADSSLVAAEDSNGVKFFTPWGALQAKFNNASTVAGNPTRITLTGNVTASGNETALVIPAGKYVTLDLSGNTIDRGLAGKDAADNGNVITVNGNLTLTDSSTDHTGKITGGNIDGYGGGVYVDSHGEFTMEGGTITGCNAVEGGGVYVDGGTFTMEAGTISGCRANYKGGGVLVQGGTFTMNGGTITNCNAESGGGVNVANGRFTMEGGTISGCSAGSGGGVCVTGSPVEKGMFIMESGTITGCKAVVGGGVYVYFSGTFTMEGGTISACNAIPPASLSSGVTYLIFGGGVFVDQNGTFNMDGGTISACTASSPENPPSGVTYKISGGGVYVYDSATFNISGTPVIRGNKKDVSANNVVLDGGKTITVSGALTDGAEIHVNAGLGVPIAEKGGDRTTALTETEAGYFKCDQDPPYKAGLNEAGQVVFKTALPAIANATRLTYNGTEQEPELTFDGVSLTAGTDYTVSYKKVAGGTETEISGSPKDAGDYKAVATGKGSYAGTSEAEFTIDRKEVTVSSGIAAKDRPYDGTINAELITRDAVFTGKCTGDSLTVSGKGTFADASAGTNKTVTIDQSSLTLGGTSSGNYILAGSGNQETATANITKATPTITSNPEADALTYGQTLADSALSNGVAKLGETVIEGTFAWSNSSTKPAVADSNQTEYTVTFTPNDTTNLNQTTCKVKLTVNKADITADQITPPAKIEDLKYTGQALPLITAGSVTGNTGTMEYALGTDAATAPTSGWATSIPTETNAGTYYVWYKVKGDGNHNDVAACLLTVDIAKAHFTNKTVSGNTKYGLSGTIELKDHIAPGGTVGTLSITDADSVLEGAPVLTGTVLSYSFKSVSENVGKTATVTIPVNNATNYKDYSITATLNVINCEHPNTELRNIKEATCTEKGCKGDLYCTECNSLLLKGEEIPINPDNHAFVLASVVSSPDSMTGEIRTYRCSRCGKTYTDPLITSPKTDENGNTTESVAVGGVTVEEVTVDKTTGKETVSTRVWVSGLNSSYTYTGAAIKPSFKVYSGTTLLKEGTDYSVSYKNNKNAGTAYVYIKFKGNYKDTKTETLSFSIAAATLGKAVIAHQVGVAEKKKAQKPVPVLTWADTGKKVSSQYFNISYSPATVKTAGEYTATITPKSGTKNFTGSTTAKVVVTDKAKLLSSAKVTFSPKSYAYTGGEIMPGYTLTLGGVTLTEGRDYKRVSLCNNIKPGSAAVIFEGMNGYYGSKTATFKISGRIGLDNSSDFTYTYSSSVAYTKGGAKPAVSVKDNKNGVTLTEGTDYTLSYSKNKAVTNGAVIMVKGKGSYKGTVTLYFAITQQSLSALESNIHAADQFVVKKKLKKPTVTIYDLDGKKLSVNRDFTIGAAGTPSGDEKSGTVTVTVYGIGAYTGQAAVTYRYMEKSANISAARLRSKIADQEYTGNAVKLSYADLTNKLYISGSGTSKNLVPGTDFVIASYSSNIKKGTAKVTIRGIGAYAGTKTLSFKIVQRKVNYAGKLWN